jgi:hypothetical protein
MPRRSQPTARLNDHVGFRWFRGGGWVGDMYALSWFLAGAGWLVPWPVSMHQSFSGADCFLASSAFKLAYGRVRGAHWNCLAGRVDMTIVRSSDDLARLASCVRRTSEVSDIYDSLAIATELPLLPAPRGAPLQPAMQSTRSARESTQRIHLQGHLGQPTGEEGTTSSGPQVAARDAPPTTAARGHPEPLLLLLPRRLSHDGCSARPAACERTSGPVQAGAATM